MDFELNTIVEECAAAEKDIITHERSVWEARQLRRTLLKRFYKLVFNLEPGSVVTDRAGRGYKVAEIEFPAGREYWARPRIRGYPAKVGGGWSTRISEVHYNYSIFNHEALPRE